MPSARNALAVRANSATASVRPASSPGSAAGGSVGKVDCLPPSWRATMSGGS
jgi:hypothetical protein